MCSRERSLDRPRGFSRPLPSTEYEGRAHNFWFIRNAPVRRRPSEIGTVLRRLARPAAPLSGGDAPARVLLGRRPGSVIRGTVAEASDGNHQTALRI